MGKHLASDTVFRRIDAEIERLLFDSNTNLPTGITQNGELLPFYSSDPSAADTIVRQIEAIGGKVYLTDLGDDIECTIFPPDHADWTIGEASAKSTPLALCGAVLRAAHYPRGLSADAHIRLEQIPLDYFN